jgi:hypothetical protein
MRQKLIFRPEISASKNLPALDIMPTGYLSYPYFCKPEIDLKIDRELVFREHKVMVLLTVHYPSIRFTRT